MTSSFSEGCVECTSRSACIAHERKKASRVCVENLWIDLGEAMAAALVDLQLRTLDDSCRLLAGGCNRHNLVVIRRNPDLPENTQKFR
jgi:hypothetical protein